MIASRKSVKQSSSSGPEERETQEEASAKTEGEEYTAAADAG